MEPPHALPPLRKKIFFPPIHTNTIAPANNLPTCSRHLIQTDYLCIVPPHGSTEWLVSYCP